MPHSAFVASIFVTALMRDSGDDGGVSSTLRISAFEQGRARLPGARRLLCCAACGICEVSLVPCEVTFVSRAPARGARGVSALASFGATGDDVHERRRASSSAVRSSSRHCISRRAFSCARCISSRRSEHSTASSAFAPLVGEEAAFKCEVLRSMSATVRADTDRACMPL